MHKENTGPLNIAKEGARNQDIKLKFDIIVFCRTIFLKLFYDWQIS